VYGSVAEPGAGGAEIILPPGAGDVIMNYGSSYILFFYSKTLEKVVVAEEGKNIQFF
jgi:hypothetical protein